MEKHTISRRDVMLAGGAMVAGLAFLRLDRLVAAAPLEQGEELVPWLDQPAEVPAAGPGRSSASSSSGRSWTPGSRPTDKFFTIKHFGQPTVDMAGVAPRRRRPGQAAAEPDARPDEGPAAPGGDLHASSAPATRACRSSGAGIGNATWAGTPLAPLLQEAGILDQGKEVVFYGHDIGKQKVRDMELTPAVRAEHVDRRRDEPEHPALLRDERRSRSTPGHGAPLRLLDAGLVRRRQRQVAGPHRGDRHPLRGALHGPRLRDDPRGAARRPAGLDRDAGRAGRCSSRRRPG